MSVKCQTWHPGSKVPPGRYFRVKNPSTSADLDPRIMGSEENTSLRDEKYIQVRYITIINFDYRGKYLSVGLFPNLLIFDCNCYFGQNS